jgi:hypothetical protein
MSLMSVVDTMCVITSSTVSSWAFGCDEALGSAMLGRDRSRKCVRSGVLTLVLATTTESASHMVNFVIVRQLGPSLPAFLC